MSRKRKTITMLVTISYPIDDGYGHMWTAADMRKEVRHLIEYQATDVIDADEIKVRKVTAATNTHFVRL